jgi:uncharacterized membrane protein
MRVLLLLFMALMVIPASAQTDDSTSPPPPDDAVHGIFFYLDTCPACHVVMDDHLPGMFERFGDNFQLLMVELHDRNNQVIVSQVCQALDVAQCGSVPLMIIGDEWMLGAVDIPDRAPGLIAAGIDDGGIPLPEVHILRQAWEDAANGTPALGVTLVSGEGSSEVVAAVADGGESSIFDTFSQDPEGNTIAVGVLAVLIFGLGMVVAGGWYGQFDIVAASSRHAPVIIGGGVLLALSLAFGGDSEALPQMLALGAALLLVVALALSVQPGRRFDAIPAVVIAGLLVAGYLAYIETAETEAVCGLVGDCSAVQQSSYASLFGVLPVGVFGIIGYVMIGIAWIVARVERSDAAQAALLVMALFGVAFSIYLTFLEPFVIGASCAWCLTSALTMLALAWLSAPEGFPALKRLLDSRDTAPRRA